MKFTKDLKQEIIYNVAGNHKNTGSSEVQITLLTKRISILTEHLKTFPKDLSSKHGLLKLVQQRKRNLKYLKYSNIESFQNLTNDLNIRVRNW